MREFRDPATITLLSTIGTVVSGVSTVVGLFSGSPKGQTQQVSSAEDEAAREKEAREEAERKQAAEDKARQGRRRTLVVQPQGALSSDIQSQRKTLLGQTGAGQAV